MISDMTEEEYKKLLSSLQALCVKREYCTQDMHRKAVKAAEGDTAVAAKLLEDLVRDRFVDDDRYAYAFAREKSSLTGWGPAKISYALRMRGIPGQTIVEALARIDAPAASSRLRKLLEAKWKVLRDDPYGKFKLIKYGLSRGYEYDEVSPLVEIIIKESL